MPLSEADQEVLYQAGLRFAHIFSRDLVDSLLAEWDHMQPAEDLAPFFQGLREACRNNDRFVWKSGDLKVIKKGRPPKAPADG